MKQKILRIKQYELNPDQSITLLATTTTLARKEDLVWRMLSRHFLQTMYVYSDLIESQVVGDDQANVIPNTGTPRSAG